MSVVSFVVIQLAIVACGHKSDDRPQVAMIPGRFVIAGLSAPVRVVRDRFGIPHIYAQSRDDLFAAQGFVQAQDRLFQMDLWRRAAQGRLAEVLGANFIERDAMTRRIQYRGDVAAEWDSYGPDARPIAAAFVRGINAWVAIARRDVPEPFVLAGWTPDVWSADDLLNRTDAFAAGGVLDEAARAGMSEVVADAIRRIGAPPFFSILSRSVGVQANGDRSVSLRADGRNDRELVSPRAYIPEAASMVDVRDGVLLAAESTRRFEQPPLRYLVHLNAPGWNIVGATAPWRPGVAMGHNDHLAWSYIAIPSNTEHIVEVPVEATAMTIKDTIPVRGRAEPFEYETEITASGVVIASDRERKRNIALQWRGFEPGWAPELAALAIDVARAPEEFASAASKWRAPSAAFVTLTKDGRLARVGQEPRAGHERQIGPMERGRDVEQTRRLARAMFDHPLAITAAARRRFAVGPVARPHEDQPLRLRLDPSEWDQSRAIVVPGQSESPASRHYADMLSMWTSGEMPPLLFSDEAVRANTESTMALVPRAGKQR